MRVFFALWPDTAVRQSLLAAQAGLHAITGGRRMRPETLHMTLVFIGELATDRLPELLNAAGRVQAPGFDIAFDRVECWRRNHIAHLGVSETPIALADLVGQLETALKALRIPFDQRPYTPHITLVRNADCTKENPASPSVTWPARDFVLVKTSLHPEGARYEQLGRWPLL